MMAYIRAETCSCILYIATNCNILVFMTVCIYKYIHTTALCYPKTLLSVHRVQLRIFMDLRKKTAIISLHSIN